MAKVSTTRSDEDSIDPGSTLSLLIVSFHLSGHVSQLMALKPEYRKEHVLPEWVKTTVPAVSTGTRI